MAVTASTIVKAGRTVATRSRIEASIPRMCRMFFGHPYTAPGTTPKKFFMLHVMPAQWCVFSFGIDTTRSARSTEPAAPVDRSR